MADEAVPVRSRLEVQSLLRLFNNLNLKTIMETLYLIMGAIAVLATVGVVVVSKLSTKISNIQEDLRLNENKDKYIYQHVEDLERNLHLRIDEVKREADQQFQEVYRQLDSRLDKLENKLKSASQKK